VQFSTIIEGLGDGVVEQQSAHHCISVVCPENGVRGNGYLEVMSRSRTNSDGMGRQSMEQKTLDTKV
jgi:hypothetical protein